MRVRLALLSTLTLSLVGACLVPDIDLLGKACDAVHPCQAGQLCQAGICALPTLDGSAGNDGGPGLDASGGTDSGLDAGPYCSATTPYCRGTGYYTCIIGQETLLDTCGVGTRCDDSFGCVPTCTGGTSCPTGMGCDEASEDCVETPVCESDAGCTLATCVSGACLDPNPKSPVVRGTDGGTAADFSCYASPDASAIPDAAMLVAFHGQLQSPAGKPTDKSIGLQVNLYRAADFNIPISSPPMAATTAVLESSVAVDGGFGAFFFDGGIPAGEPLVAVSQGTGAKKTLHYFTLRPETAVAGLIDAALVSFDETLWGVLVQGAGVKPKAHAAGISGQVFDCRSSPLRVEGATAALNTPSTTFYGFPGLVGVDPLAKGTPDTGRFFFFDVPAMPLTVVGGTPGSTQQIDIRPLADSVVVVTLRPNGK